MMNPQSVTDNQEVWLRAAPWDSLFFRENRPWVAPGGAGLRSHFPPPAATVAGAVRAALDQAADETGIRMRGPYLSRDGEALYPSPASHCIVQSPQGAGLTPVLARRFPGESPVQTDLGRVLLPQNVSPGFRAPEDVENHWMTVGALGKFLAGQIAPNVHAVALEELIHQDNLAIPDIRVGHRRDPATGAAEEGLLYNTQHVRLAHGLEVSLAVQVSRQRSLQLQQQSWSKNARFGGEGRMAHFSVGQPIAHPSSHLAPSAAAQFAPRLAANEGKLRFFLYFVTPAIFAGTQPGSGSGNFRDWYKAKKIVHTSRYGVIDCWSCAPFARLPTEKRRPRVRIPQSVRAQQELHFRIMSACCHKPVRLGGYSSGFGPGRLAIGLGSRPLQSYQAAGSIWFCEIDIGAVDPLAASKEALEKLGQLHGKQLGSQRELGFGEVLVGLGW